MFPSRHIVDRSACRARRLWANYGIFWFGVVLVGLVSVAYAKLIDAGLELFRSMVSHALWLPIAITPMGAALAIWLARQFFRGAEGSGIPQVIAMLEDGRLSSSSFPLRVMFGKVVVSFLGIFCGSTIGRRGPAVQIGASLMYAMCRGYRRNSKHIERQFTLAGAAAGFTVAFNMPLAGIAPATEELTHSFVVRNSGTLITAIILSGVIALGLQGNYLYFGRIQAIEQFHLALVSVVIAASAICGVADGVFCWLLLNIPRWMSVRLTDLRQAQLVWFVPLCGVAIVLIGLVSDGTTFGSGYAEVRGLLETHQVPSPLYAVFKFGVLIVSYLSGISGGTSAPLLAIGVGLGNVTSFVTSSILPPSLAVLCMVGYLATATQSPITSFVTVIETIDGHEMVLPLMAMALLSSQILKALTPSFYHTLARRFCGLVLRPAAWRTQVGTAPRAVSLLRFQSPATSPPPRHLNRRDVDLVCRHRRAKGTFGRYVVRISIGRSERTWCDLS